jgi:hypothetical protein
MIWGINFVPEHAEILVTIDKLVYSPVELIAKATPSRGSIGTSSRIRRMCAAA